MPPPPPPPQLESFNPATGERSAPCRHRARGRPGGRRRRRRGAAVLGAADARGPRRATCERAAQVVIDESDEIRDLHRPRAGQAAQRGVLDGAPADDRRAALDRRRRAPRSSPTRVPMPQLFLKTKRSAFVVRAARRDRGDLALELPVEHPVRRGGAGADGGQRRGAQAGLADPADRRADRSRCSSAPGVPEGLVRVVHGPGTGAALAESSVGKVFFTGLGRDRARRRPRRARGG